MGNRAGEQRPAVDAAMYVCASTAYSPDAAAAAIRRQARAIRAWMPAGWDISAVYADAGHDDEEAAAIYRDVGISPAGRITAMLAAAAGPTPGFTVVACDDLTRISRDTRIARQAEENLAAHGTPLYTAGTPAETQAGSARAVLTRRAMQATAEYDQLSARARRNGGGHHDYDHDEENPLIRQVRQTVAEYHRSKQDEHARAARQEGNR